MSFLETDRLRRKLLLIVNNEGNDGNSTTITVINKLNNLVLGNLLRRDNYKDIAKFYLLLGELGIKSSLIEKLFAYDLILIGEEHGDEFKSEVIKAVSKCVHDSNLFKLKYANEADDILEAIKNRVTTEKFDIFKLCYENGIYLNDDFIYMSNNDSNSPNIIVTSSLSNNVFRVRKLDGNVSVGNFRVGMDGVVYFDESNAPKKLLTNMY